MADLETLRELMQRLRDPQQGCPWDLEQSFETIAPYTVEEAYEVDDAIRRSAWRELCGELGDLLLQVVYHAQLAQEAGHFDLDDVVEAISSKLIRRHPHVFEDAPRPSAERATDLWERLKAAERAERGEVSALDDVPQALPALLRAAKLERRAQRCGLIEPLPQEISDRLEGSADGEGVGDLLLQIARESARRGLDPEALAREATARFEVRLRSLERAVRAGKEQEAGSAAVSVESPQRRSDRRGDRAGDGGSSEAG